LYWFDEELTEMILLPPEDADVRKAIAKVNAFEPLVKQLSLECAVLLFSMYRVSIAVGCTNIIPI